MRRAVLYKYEPVIIIPLFSRIRHRKNSFNISLAKDLDPASFRENITNIVSILDSDTEYLLNMNMRERI